MQLREENCQPKVDKRADNLRLPLMARASSLKIPCWVLFGDFDEEAHDLWYLLSVGKHKIKSTPKRKNV